MRKYRIEGWTGAVDGMGLDRASREDLLLFAIEQGHPVTSLERVTVREIDPEPYEAPPTEERGGAGIA